MIRKRTTDTTDTTPWTAPLTEVLEAGLVPEATTIGALVDAITARGDAIGVDPAGRLAITESALARLEAEAAERERIAQEAAEKAEAERLAHLAEQAKKQAEAEEQRERRRAIGARKARLEQVTGCTLIELEQEMRRSITHKPGTGMSLDGRAAIEAKIFTLEDLEAYVRDLYGPEILDREEAK